MWASGHVLKEKAFILTQCFHKILIYITTLSQHITALHTVWAENKSSQRCLKTANK